MTRDRRAEVASITSGWMPRQGILENGVQRKCHGEERLTIPPHDLLFQASDAAGRLV